VGGAGGSGGTGGVGGSGGVGGAGGSGSGGAGGSGSGGAGGSGSGGAGGSGGSGGSGVSQCSAARAQLIGAVDSVASGAVTVLGSSGGVTSLYVDATAGGGANAPTNPWIFVDLASGAKVGVTDVTALSSTAWDLAFKRPLLYTNDGDGGPGQGGAVLVAKDFADVTAADAAAATFATERFFDGDCNAVTDPTGAAQTTFSGWYQYNEMSHQLTPTAGTWLVRGATGKLYKLRIVTYYSTPSGAVGTTSGNYALEVEAL
jgi:hypothetical protein